MKNNMKTNVNDRCYCPQCDSSYDYKEMADENICQECVSRLREYKKVDFKKLLKEMQDEDIEEVYEELAVESEKDELKKNIKKEIDDWFYDTENREILHLTDRIIKLI